MYKLLTQLIIRKNFKPKSRKKLIGPEKINKEQSEPITSIAL